MQSHFYTEHSHLEKLSGNLFYGHEKLYIKRDDLIHPVVSGNKWRKLKYQLQTAQKNNQTHLVTFGGAYSNHMIATACAAAALGFKSSCFVRGHELTAQSNHYLRLASLYGMQLIPVNREDYRNKLHLFETHFSHDPHAYYIAEGGEGEMAYAGVEEIISELPFEPDFIVHASATATTTTGLLMGLKKYNMKNARVVAVPVLLNAEEQFSKISNRQLEQQLMLATGYEMGGYAKTTDKLLDFMQKFISETGILIDQVYTAKAWMALQGLIEKKEISKDKSVVFLHTGGTLGSI